MQDAAPEVPPAAPSLRIAVAVDRDWVYGWEREILEQAARLRGIDLTSIVRVSAPRPSEACPAAWRLARAVDNGLSRVLFHRNYRRAGRDHDARTPLSALTLASVVRMHGTPSSPGAINCEYLLDLTDDGSAAVTGIRPALGTFHLEWGDPNPLTGKPDGAAEVLARKPYSMSRLFLVPADGTSPRALTQLFRTFLCSWSENARRLHWSSAMLVLDSLRDLAARGRASRIWSAPPAAALRAKKASRPPSAGVVASGMALAAMAGRILERVIQRRTTKDEWCIRLLPDFASVDAIKGYANWEELTPPEDRAWADPFVIERNGRTFVFVEEIAYASDKGVITCLEHTPTGTRRLGVVLDEPHHLSYPFLFEHRGDLLMLPESSAGRELAVWKCVDFPMQWTKHRVLFEGISMVDATVVKKDDLWWLFATIDRIGGGDLTSELHAFYSDDPVTGTWQPHAMNPLLVDPRCARMAGKIAWMDGFLIRFSQGSGFEYGETLHMRRITDLTPASFAEEPHATFLPAPGHISLHHFSTWNNVAVVDCCRRLRKAGLRGAASIVLPNVGEMALAKVRHDTA